MRERIILLIEEEYKGRVAKFAKAIGQERADNTYNVIKGRSRPGLEYIEAILETHPHISAEWFLRGEGERIKGELQYPQDYEDTKRELKEATAEYIKILNKYNKLLEERQK